MRQQYGARHIAIGKVLLTDRCASHTYRQIRKFFLAGYSTGMRLADCDTFDKITFLNQRLCCIPQIIRTQLNSPIGHLEAFGALTVEEIRCLFTVSGTIHAGD